MTETVPERIWITFARKDFGRDPKDKGSSSYIGDANDGPVDADAEYVPATALEAAQARIQALEDTLNIERALSDGAHRRARTARLIAMAPDLAAEVLRLREALERPEMIVIRELIHRHHKAAKNKDEESRARIFSLIDELEWAFPEARAALEGRE